MPQRPDDHVVAQRAVNAVERVLLDPSLGYAFLRVPGDNDYGIDGFIQIRNEAGTMLPLEVPVQVKGAAHAGRSEMMVHSGYPVLRDRLLFLAERVVPGILVLYDDRTQDLFFLRAAEALQQCPGDKKRLRYPIANRFTADAIARLAREACDHVEEIRRKLAGSLRPAAIGVYEGLAHVYDHLVEFTLLTSTATNMNMASLCAAAQSKPENTDDERNELLTRFADILANEYEVTPPYSLVSNFPGSSMWLAALDYVSVLIDDARSALSGSDPDILAELGMTHLEAVVSGVRRRASGDESNPEEIRNRHRPSLRWVIIKPAHLFMGLLQVTFVVRAVLIGLRLVILERNRSKLASRRTDSSIGLPLGRLWIKYQGHT
jgi:hypothetical protein